MNGKDFLRLPVLLLCGGIVFSLPVSGSDEHEVVIERSDRAVIDARVHEAIEVAGVLLHDEALTDHLNELVAHIVNIQPGTVPPYRVLLINGSEINAFSLSDGTVYLSLGIFSMIDNDAQLALLLAHEIAHVRLDHHRRFRYEMHERSAGSFIFSGDTPYSMRVALSGFSRSLEREADSCALRTLVERGYNAWEAKKLLATMYYWLKYKEKDYSSEQATHPKFAERYRTAKKTLESLEVDSTYGIIDEAAYQKVIQPHLPHIVNLLRQSNNVRELYKMALHKLDGNDPLPEWYYLRGSLLEYYAASDSFPVAVSSLTSAYSNNPANTRSIRDLGWLYLKNGMHDSARVCLSRYLKAAPEAPDAGIVEFYLEKLGE